MNVDLKQEDDHQMCVRCMNGKLNVESFPKSKNSEIKTSGVLELIHNDVMDPMQIKSHGGAKYVLKKEKEKRLSTITPDILWPISSHRSVRCLKSLWNIKL